MSQTGRNQSNNNAAQRIQTIGQHLTSATTTVDRDRDGVSRERLLHSSPDPGFGNSVPLLTMHHAQSLTNECKVMFQGKPYNLADHLPGPMQQPNADLNEILCDADRNLKEGNMPNWWMEAQDSYANGSRISNIVYPIVMNEPMKRAYITNSVLLNDPIDCERIARTHVQKQPNFQNNGFFHSIISTDDNESWKQQRSHMIEAFLPMASIAKILPTSLARASKCAEMMEALIAAENGVVDMSDFFLHETQAQLQLAMFGESEEFMERTNKALRRTFNGDPERPTMGREIVMALTDRMKDNTNNTTCPSMAKATGCPVRGPLANRIASFDGERSQDYSTLFGNGLIFAFAGHDTTGHTLTWLLYEVSKNENVKRRLVAEIDGFLSEVGDRDITYLDLKKLPFLTRCIFETLRLWPAVGNGTFRSIEFDDYCNDGKGGQVKLPKGTFVQVNTWCRHRSPELWGADVNDFNPDRNFTDHEIWENEGLRAYNMSSARFSPFTYSPRGCIGMNFAQMEMRLILIKLLSQYDFNVVPTDIPLKNFMINRGTMGPRKSSFPSPVVNGRMKVPTVGMDFEVQRRK